MTVTLLGLTPNFAELLPSKSDLRKTARLLSHAEARTFLSQEVFINIDYDELTLFILGTSSSGEFHRMVRVGRIDKETFVSLVTSESLEFHVVKFVGYASMLIAHAKDVVALRQTFTNTFDDYTNSSVAEFKEVLPTLVIGHAD